MKKRLVIILTAAIIAVLAATAEIVLIPKINTDTDTKEHRHSSVLTYISVLKYIQENAAEIGIGDVNDELSFAKSEECLDNTVYTFNQVYEDIPVYGRSVSVLVDKNNSCAALSDNYEYITADTEVVVDEEELINCIGSAYGSEATGFYVEELVIYSLHDYDPQLCWSVYVSKGNEAERAFFSAKDGALIKTEPLTYYDTVKGSGEDINEDKCTFNTYTDDNVTYYMTDTEKNIKLYDAEEQTLDVTRGISDEDGNFYYFNQDKQIFADSNGSEVGVYSNGNNTFTIEDENGSIITENGISAFYLSTNKSIWTKKVNSDDIHFFSSLSEVTNTSTTWDNPKAVTVMYTLEELYDFYAETFGRYGYNGARGDVYAVINDYKNGDKTNASSYKDLFGRTLLSFGMDCSLSKDLIGHEYRHTVTASTGNGLESETESGALNEAYSDIFGELFEDWEYNGRLSNSCDWVYGDSGRNFINPIISGNPAVYHGKNWEDAYDIDSDNGGVHNNSTVISHAAYLMSMGLYKDDSVEHLTNEKMADLFYTTAYMLPYTCTFEGFSRILYVVGNVMYKNGDISLEQLMCIALSLKAVGLPITDQSISGKVVTESGEPIEGATVDFLFNNVLMESVLTDADGKYSVELPVAEYDIKVTKAGYSTEPETQRAKLPIKTKLKLEDIVLEGSMAAAYAEVIKEYEDKYGTYNIHLLSWCIVANGVDYLKLVDMDGDGTEELIIGGTAVYESNNYSVDIWTYKNDKAELVGTVPCYLIGIEVNSVCSIMIDGQFALVGGGSFDDGYTAWTYDGESLNAVATYSMYELDNSSAATFTYLNAGESNTEKEKAKMMSSWNTVRETKEALSCITEAEKAAAEYQFTLIYDNTTGWYAVKDAYSLKLEYIYVDDDDVPELVVSTGSYFSDGAYVYTYKDGKVIRLGQFGCFGNLQYSAKNNLILTDLTRQGSLECSYYRIEDGKAVLIHSFVCAYEQDTYANTGVRVCSDYKLDGVSVSESEYNAALAEVTDGITYTTAGHSTGQYMYQVMGD